MHPHTEYQCQGININEGSKIDADVNRPKNTTKKSQEKKDSGIQNMTLIKLHNICSLGFFVCDLRKFVLHIVLLHSPPSQNIKFLHACIV